MRRFRLVLASLVLVSACSSGEAAPTTEATTTAPSTTAMASTTTTTTDAPTTTTATAPATVEVTGIVAAPTEQIQGELSGTAPEGAGVPWTTMTGTIYRGFNHLSDERVSGNFEQVMNIDITVEGDRTTGQITITSMTITNDNGTWEGTGEGTTSWTTTEPDHVHHIDYTLKGTGDYEGLQFAYYLEGIDYPWTLTGTIEPVDS